jgi:hypothetical protein
MFHQGALSTISRIVKAKTTRFSSYDRSGGNKDSVPVATGETITLAECEGAGVVKHIWFTVMCEDELHRRALVLRAYWDGQEHPSVEAPLGDFFGQGWGMEYNFVSLPLAATPKEGKGLVCYFPMPFGKGVRITLENQSDKPVEAFYFYIDVEHHDSMPDEEGRFHAWYNQELTKPESELGDKENEHIDKEPEPKNKSDKHNYLFCECEGEGHFVGVNYYVNSPSPLWYGEGDDMFMVDGEPWPGSAHGTGTEDYFNTAWGPDEHYLHPYFGLARVPGVHNRDGRYGYIGRTHCYRFHFEDPIRFTKSLRASIEHGHANSHTLEIATVAYWYQSLPSKPFPALPSYEERKPRPLTDWLEVHRWRDRWRQDTGGGKLWGSETKE